MSDQQNPAPIEFTESAAVGGPVYVTTPWPTEATLDPLKIDGLRIRLAGDVVTFAPDNGEADYKVEEDKDGVLLLKLLPDCVFEAPPEPQMTSSTIGGLGEQAEAIVDGLAQGDIRESLTPEEQARVAAAIEESTRQDDAENAAAVAASVTQSVTEPVTEDAQRPEGDPPCPASPRLPDSADPNAGKYWNSHLQAWVDTPEAAA